MINSAVNRNENSPLILGKNPYEKVVNFQKYGKTFIHIIDNMAVDDKNLVIAGIHVSIFFKAEKILCHSNPCQKFMLS